MVLLSGFDALFSQGSGVPALPPSTTSLPPNPLAIFIGLLVREGRGKKENEEGEFKLTCFPATQYFWVIDGRWHALKINLSINSAHGSLLGAFTAVCGPAENILSGCRQRTRPSPYRCKLFIYCYYLDVTKAPL